MREMVGIGITDEKFMIAHVFVDQDNFLDIKHIEQRSYLGDDPKEVLKSLVQELEIEEEDCVITLNDHEYELFLIPQPDNQEDHQALRHTVSDLLDYPIESAMIDYIKLPNNQTVNPMGYIVAAKDHAINEKVDMVQNAGLNVIAVDIPEMGLRNIFGTIFNDGMSRIMIHIMPNHTKLIKMTDFTLEMSRKMELNSDWIFSEDTQSNFYEDNINNLVQNLISEVERSLIYSEANLGQEKCQEIVMISYNDVHDKVIQKMKELSTIPVRKIQLDKKFKNITSVKSNHLYQMIYSVGAALRGVESC